MSKLRRTGVLGLAVLATLCAGATADTSDWGCVSPSPLQARPIYMINPGAVGDCTECDHDVDGDLVEYLKFIDEHGLTAEGQGIVGDAFGFCQDGLLLVGVPPSFGGLRELNTTGDLHIQIFKTDQSALPPCDPPSGTTNACGLYFAGMWEDGSGNLSSRAGSRAASWWARPSTTSSRPATIPTTRSPSTPATW